MLHRRRLLLYKQSQAEPNYDIMVWAASGYDGVVRVNGADFQLTHDANDTELWYGTAPSSVTSLDYFAKVDSRANYNSTSVYITKVKFGTGMFAKTSGLTTLEKAFCVYGWSSNIKKIDVSNISTSNVISMYGTFAIDSANELTELIGLESWNVSNVTNFGYFLSLIKNDILDLHNWHVNSSASITSMFGALNIDARNGINPCIYITPGYSGIDLFTLLGSDRVKPTVYPYHDITVASNSSFNGDFNVNGNTVTMTKDNTLDIWYYDLPSDTTLTSLSVYTNTSSRENVTSFALGDRFANYPSVISIWRAFSDCTNLRSVYLPSGIEPSCNQTFIATALTTPVLSNIYGMDKFKFTGGETTGGQYMFHSQSNLRYVDIAPVTFTSYYNYLFSNCTNLIRIKNLPGLASTATANSPFVGCTSLTTIDASGPISKTLSFADSPLTLDSAKVILNALQIVTSETLTFSSATCALIQADNDAKQLVVEAIAKGWNVPGVNVSIPSITNQQMYDIFYSGAASDTNVWVTIKFNLNNPGGYEITKCGVCRAMTINPNTSTVTTTTDAGEKSVNLSGHTYNNTYYFRSFVTFTKFDGTSQTVFADNLTYTPQYVLSRQSASGTSGTCSVRTNGTSATNIYVNVRCNCYPVATYNTSSYSLKWELRRSSVTGTVVCSGTASYQSGVTAFYTHGNVTMSNSNTTKYTHYFIFWRDGDTSHKVYYVSNNTFAEKGTADQWTLFHYYGKNY